MQSNHEGELFDALHRACTECSAIIFNPAGYTHTSVVLRGTASGVRRWGSDSPTMP